MGDDITLMTNSSNFLRLLMTEGFSSSVFFLFFPRTAYLEELFVILTQTTVDSCRFI